MKYIKLLYLIPASSALWMGLSFSQESSQPRIVLVPDFHRGKMGIYQDGKIIQTKPIDLNIFLSPELNAKTIPLPMPPKPWEPKPSACGDIECPKPRPAPPPPPPCNPPCWTPFYGNQQDSIIYWPDTSKKPFRFKRDISKELEAAHPLITTPLTQ